MFKPPEYADAHIEQYKKNVIEYLEKGEENFPFKPFGAMMGVYMERSGNTFMVRPRSPGGLITVEQLKAMSKIANKYSKKQFRFTTRQDIQLHKVDVKDTIEIMEELKKVNMFSVGTGGNTVRNVACSPLSGLERGEAFDVTPFALEATNYIVADENSTKMPRKLKLSFSNSKKDTGNATFADLGFIATIKDGLEGFEVFIAGGYGGGSRVSLKLTDFIEAEDVLYYVDAIKEFFYKEGDRENKAKARLRHLVKKFGEEEFTRKYYKYLSVSKEKDLKLDIEKLREKYVEPQNTTVRDKIQIESKLVEETKYDGIYSVYVHPRRAKIETRDLNKITKFIDSLDYDVTIRLTPTQGFMIRGLSGSDSELLLDIIKDFTSQFDIDNSLVCVGADTCRTGIGSSQKLFQNILLKFKNVPEDIKTQIPKLYVSGCPSSCGQHLRGQIGFSGKLKRIDGKSVSVYAVYFDGRVGEDAKLGERYGDIKATDIPKFLYEMALLKRKSGYTDFSKFFDKSHEQILDLVEEYDVSDLSLKKRSYKTIDYKEA